MDIDALFRQANAAVAASDWAGAEAQFQALIPAKPLWAHHNLGTIYVSTGRLAEAEAAFRAALIDDPASAPTAYSLSRLLLRTGRYGEGWRLYEARRRSGFAAIPNPRLAFPEWRGESLAGRHLLLIPEQGLGDQIMMARFIPELRRRAARVTFLCHPALVSLFTASGIEAVAANIGDPYPVADCWTLLLSLPLLLGVTPETLDGRPYLSAPAFDGHGIGIKATGSLTHENDRNRSLSPADAAWLGRFGRDLDPAATGATDFLQTAGLIAGLDLVVTVDTSVAHLAGAMGKPVRILLPFIDTDWRWPEGATRSSWYGSATLYRQPGPGQWGPALAAATAGLTPSP